MSSAPNQNLSAAQLSQHPLWMAASGRGGRGRGRGRGRGPPSDIGDAPIARPRFERISLASIEQDQYEQGDGAESHISFSASELGEQAGPSGSGPGPSTSKAKRKAKRKPKDDSSDDDDDDDDDETDARRRRLDGMLGSAAFGGGKNIAPDDDDETAPSEADSKKMKDASRAAFPCKGLNCVGCALSHRIGVVDKFVNENVSSMTEDALYKLAALRYKIEVAAPIEREGGAAPPWGWKNLRAHYELHVTTNHLARHKVVRQLQLLRSQLESRLVRCEGDEREVDRSNADLLLKCISAESRERVLIDGAGVGSGKGKKKD